MNDQPIEQPAVSEPVPGAAPIRPARRFGGVRRLGVAGLLTMALVAFGGVAVVNAASPSSSATPAASSSTSGGTGSSGSAGSGAQGTHHCP